MAGSVPFRWPGAWIDPGALNLPGGSPITCTPTLRATGWHRAARLSTLDLPAACDVASVTQKDTLQVRPRPVKVSAGVEREI
ncbi:MAG: hypothetical protein NTW28_01450 [Candidatus Solibacter sp.]|nr:hypothetical protein [Candidatus Solibacter sp.]